MNLGRVVYRAGGKKHTLAFDGSGARSADFAVVVSAGRTGGVERVTVRLEAVRAVELIEVRAEFGVHMGPRSRVFVNGYQSWTESREYGAGERRSGLSRLFYPAFKKYLLYNYGDAVFARTSGLRGRFHSWTLTYVRPSADAGLIRFFGSLAERTGFTRFEVRCGAGRIDAVKDCRGLQLDAGTVYEALDVMETEDEPNAAFDAYFAMLGAAPPKLSAVTGWTSWYRYYEKITEAEVLKNLDAFRKYDVPLDVFQIDDGYQCAVGDWLNVNTKFPGGMKKTADAVHAAGYKAGLWLAPFAAETESFIVTEHPDWIVRGPDGRFFPVGNNPFNWSGYWYALDVYHPGVREYLKKVFDTVLGEWGFDMVKLDFLYAACIRPLPGKTRGQIMFEAMELVRELAGDKLILGCGMPLGAGFGKVDFCRVGSDVSPGWEDGRLKMLNYRERVSTVNSLWSTVGRCYLNGRAFLNDPDVFILRSAGQYMTPYQRKTLYTLNLLFGSLVFTSDGAADYTPAERAFYLAQFPHVPKRIVSVERKGRVLKVRFEADGRRYLAYANLTLSPVSVPMERGYYFENLAILPPESAPDAAHDGFVEGGSEIRLHPGETRVFLAVDGKPFTLAGSTGHVFPGCEIEEFGGDAENLRAVRDPKARGGGKLFVAVPVDCPGVRVNGEWVPSRRMARFNLVEYQWK